MASSTGASGVGCLDPTTGLVMGIELTTCDASEAIRSPAHEAIAPIGIRSCLVFGFDDDTELAEVRALMTKVSRPL